MTIEKIKEKIAHYQTMLAAKEKSFKPHYAMYLKDFILDSKAEYKNESNCLQITNIQDDLIKLTIGVRPEDIEFLYYLTNGFITKEDREKFAGLTENWEWSEIDPEQEMIDSINELKEMQNK